MVDNSDGLWLLISVVWAALLLAALLLDAVLRLFEQVKNAAGLPPSASRSISPTGKRRTQSSG
jgi:hypothetical protein